MANPWGVKLSKAIRDRAYAAGCLSRKAEEVAAAEAALERARCEYAAVHQGLAEIDRRIAELSVIDPEGIRPINRFPKSGLFPFGALAKSITSILKSSKEPMATHAIIFAVARQLNLPVDGDDWEVTRQRVKKQLLAYVRKGAIERLHNPAKSALGLWRWKGL